MVIVYSVKVCCTDESVPTIPKRLLGSSDTPAIAETVQPSSGSYILEESPPLYSLIWLEDLDSLPAANSWK